MLQIQLNNTMASILTFDINNITIGLYSITVYIIVCI